jgi:hypothetical protein
MPNLLGLQKSVRDTLLRFCWANLKGPGKERAYPPVGSKPQPGYFSDFRPEHSLT